MKNTYKVLIMILVIAALAAGCSEQGARELFETAQFEEVQRNTGHAVELYRKIREQYPDSEYSRKAEERLNELMMHNE